MGRARTCPPKGRPPRRRDVVLPSRKPRRSPRRGSVTSRRGKCCGSWGFSPTRSPHGARRSGSLLRFSRPGKRSRKHRSRPAMPEAARAAAGRVLALAPDNARAELIAAIARLMDGDAAAPTAPIAAIDRALEREPVARARRIAVRSACPCTRSRAHRRRSVTALLERVARSPEALTQSASPAPGSGAGKCRRLKPGPDIDATRASLIAATRARHVAPAEPTRCVGSPLQCSPPTRIAARRIRDALRGAVRLVAGTVGALGLAAAHGRRAHACAAARSEVKAPTRPCSTSLTSLSPDTFALTLATLGPARFAIPQGVTHLILPTSLGCGGGKVVAALDIDVLVDFAGMTASTASTSRATSIEARVDGCINTARKAACRLRLRRYPRPCDCARRTARCARSLERLLAGCGVDVANLDGGGASASAGRPRCGARRRTRASWRSSPSLRWPTIFPASRSARRARPAPRVPRLPPRSPRRRTMSRRDSLQRMRRIDAGDSDTAVKLCSAGLSTSPSRRRPVARARPRASRTPRRRSGLRRLRPRVARRHDRRRDTLQSRRRAADAAASFPRRRARISARSRFAPISSPHISISACCSRSRA